MSINIIIAVLNNDFKLLHTLLDPLSKKNQKLLELKLLPDINFQEPTYGNTALHYAVKSGNFEMIEALLFYGAERNIKNLHGILPMDEYEDYTSDSFIYSQTSEISLSFANDNYKKTDNNFYNSEIIFKLIDFLHK